MCVALIATWFSCTNLSAQTRDTVSIRRTLDTDAIKLDTAVVKLDSVVAKLDSAVHKVPAIVKTIDSALLLYNWNVDTGTSYKHTAASWDELALIDINHFGRTLGLDKYIIFFTNTTFYTAVLFPAAIYGLGIAKHDRDQAIAGLTLGVGIGVSTLVTEGIKAIVQRQRPFHVLLGVRTPSAGEGGYSFPSGHSTAAWALASGISFEYPKWYVIAPAMLYATAVSLSRPYLGVHYLSDLLAGAVVGVGCSYLVYHFRPELTKALPGLLPNADASQSAAYSVADHSIVSISLPIGLLGPPIH